MHYQITVQGAIDSSWSDWFAEMRVTGVAGSADAPITTLTGVVADQAALRGILTRLWDLNLTLLAVTPLEPVTGLSLSLGLGLKSEGE